MNLKVLGKWMLVCTEGFGCQPPCRGEGRVIKVGPDASECLEGNHVVFLAIECGVLEFDKGHVLVHEDYVVATHVRDASPKHHEYPGKTWTVGCSR